MERSKHREKTISGLNWSIIDKVFTQGVFIIITIILSRILSPKEFGLITMVMVIIRYAEVFQEFGMGSAIVQKKQISSSDLNTAFWINLFFGLLLTIIILVSAPLVVKYYDQPILYWITIAASFNFFLKSFNIVQSALLRKALNFKKLFHIHFWSILIAGVFAIYFAMKGYGVWSLVIQSILVALITTILLWYQTQWKPKFEFSKESLKFLFEFSLPLLGTKSIHYWVRNLDKILIGKHMGSTQLGFYEKAYSLMLLPLNSITSVIGRVMFPSLSLIQDDKERVKSIFQKMTKTIGYVTFPMMLGLYVLAEPFIISVLGEQWRGSISILKILCFVGAIQSITALFSNLYLSQGATTKQFKVGIFLRLNTIIAIIIGLRFGIEGVAYGYLVSVLINLFPNLKVAGGLVNLKIMEYLKNIFPELLISVLMAFTVYLFDLYLFNNSTNDFFRLFTGVMFGLTVYITLSYLTKNNSAILIFNYVKPFLRKN